MAEQHRTYDTLAVAVLLDGFKEALRVPGSCEDLRDRLIQCHDLVADAWDLQPIIEDEPGGPLEGEIAHLDELFRREGEE
jgi:hypothetical protein